MNYLYYILRTVTLLITIVCVFWPGPLFLLSDKMAEKYMDFLFGMSGSHDPSRFAALPFVYMFVSLPFGVAFGSISEVIWYFVRKHLLK